LVRKSRKTERSGNRNLKTYLTSATAAALSLLVYLPVLGYGFVDWDDPLFVYENTHLASIGPWLFTETFVGNLHPLTMLSYVADYWFWGLDPRGYHLTNIVLHALNSGLVVLLAASLAGASGRSAGRGIVYASLAAGLLFGLHPLHVESIAWISERKDVLSAFFFILTVLAYLRHVRSPGSKRYYCAALALFVLALASKSMAVTLPLVLLIVDFHPLGRVSGLRDLGRAVYEKLPFFGLSLACGVVTLWSQASAMASRSELTPWSRLLTAVHGYAFYIYKLLLPSGLAPYYPIDIGASLLRPAYAGAALLLAAITAATLLTLKRHRLPLAVWLYYLVTLLPVIGFVQVGDQAAADRYAYLPSIAPFILAGLVGGTLFERPGRARAAATAFLVAVTAALGLLTVGQSRIWRDPVTLWTYESEEYPNVPKVRYALGMALREIGEIERAAVEFERAITIMPGYSEAHNNLGNIYLMKGLVARAAREYRAALETAPNNAEARYNLALAYERLGLTDEAAAQYRAFIGMDLRGYETMAGRARAFIREHGRGRAP